MESSAVNPMVVFIKEAGLYESCKNTKEETPAVQQHSSKAEVLFSFLIHM